MTVTDLPSDLTPLILNGHVVDVLRSLPEESVQCVISSPPYWGLRAYGTDPQVWGGEEFHVHEWEPVEVRRKGSTNGSSEDGSTLFATDTQKLDDLRELNEGETKQVRVDSSSFCSCGAWKGELGAEPTPELFVSHLADVFDEVRRVLRDDGTLWLNLGDTYTTHPAGLIGEKRWKKSTLTEGRDVSGAEQAGSFDKRTGAVAGEEPSGNPVACRLRASTTWLVSPLRLYLVEAQSDAGKRDGSPDPVARYIFLLTKRRTVLLRPGRRTGRLFRVLYRARQGGPICRQHRARDHRRVRRSGHQEVRGNGCPEPQ